MSHILEIEGRTIDEAIFAGLEQMGVSFDEVDIDILENGNKGFLGIGSRQAKVRLTKREEIQREQKKEQSAPAQKTKPQQFQHNERPMAQTRPTFANRPTAEHAPKQQPAPIIPKKIEGEPVCNENPAVSFLTFILSYKHVDAEVQGVMTPDALHIQITGDKSAQLIGYRGETLDSLQYLTSLILNKDKQDYTRVLLDTGDYRAKREQTLIRLAQHLASKAIKSGHKVSLEPMNPYERRIIHSALQSNHRVSTCSEGEEPNRRIIISPKR